MPLEDIIAGAKHAAMAAENAAAALENSVSELAGVTGAEELAALQTGGEEIVESSSNSVSLAAKKTRDLAHKVHEYVMSVIRKTLRNSLINKLLIMLPGFALSLLTPAPVLEALRPLFAAFGSHLGFEATETMHGLIHERRIRKSVAKHELGEVPDPEKVLEEPIRSKLTEDEIIHNAKIADRWTTAEITAAVVGSIDERPAMEQATIMLIYGLGMTAGVHGLTIALVSMEDRGQRLAAWDPKSQWGKTLVKTKLPARLGLILIEASPKIFHYMPWAGAAAKYVTSGRVIAHAIPVLESAAETAAKIMEATPYFGDGLTGLVARMAVWGVVGVGTGLGVAVANKTLLTPLKKSMNESPLIQNWAKASRSLLIHAVLVTNTNTNTNLLIKPNTRPGMEIRQYYNPIGCPAPL